MKKSKNLTLLIGICCVLLVVVWKFATFVIGYFSVPSAYTIKSFIISPITILFLLLIIPIVLLTKNLKNKTGKTLPIISVITNSVVPLWLFLNSLTINVPKYLIYSELGMVNTYLTVFVNFLKNGGILFIIGYALIIIGSFLSFPFKKKS